MYSFASRSRRLARALALGAAVASISVPAAQAGEFIPGVTDFPSRPAYVQPDEFVPGVTDFPSRLGEKAEQAARDRVARAEAARSQPTVVGDTSDFAWGAAGIGAGIGAGAVFLVVLALRTRPSIALARSH